ncbi:site-specific integrase [Myxococcus vastator]|uniref:site-specific integrase n=1 Tax=Myxococcus vastator TaxID=2709664 RepID=UPI0013D0F203|nr:site-specific integrase [Myxococcus vastator]
MASTANLHGRRLNPVFVLAHQLRWPLLSNPLAKVPVLQTAPQCPKGLADLYTTCPKLLAAMPDARSRAFVSMQRWHGLRESESLGLEPRHINWSAGTVRVEQQRKPWRGFVQGLKHDTCAATFELHDETAGLLREAALESMRTGTVPRGQTARTFLFPYWENELDALMGLIRAAAQDDFPWRVVGECGGAAWHVLRHTYGTELAHMGVDYGEVQVLLRHKHLSTTQLYVDSIRGRPIPVASLPRVREEAAKRSREAAERASRGVTSDGSSITTGGVPGQ